MLALQHRHAMQLSGRPSSALPLAALAPRTARGLSQPRRPLASAQAQAQPDAAVAGRSADSGDEDRVPPGCARYTVQLFKPLGMVLEEAGGKITVAELVPEGNAERSEQIRVGDELVGCSGKTTTTEQVYGEITVRGGEKMVRINVRNESFSVVMAAIGSHSAGQLVTLDFQQCEGS